LERWCSPAAMDIAGADAALVARLVGGGLVRDVAELYRLKLREIASLDGVDEELAAKFCDALNGSRRREGWRALSGLDIPQVAAAEAKSLCRQFGSVDNVFAASAERLMAAEGIGEATAQSIARWHSDPENRRVLRRLQRAGVNFRSGL
jgi:DNA ligase (NAD+)